MSQFDINPTGASPFSRVVLDRLRIGVSQVVSREMATLASSIEFESMMDMITDSMVVELRAHVLAEKLPPQTTEHRVRVEATDPRHATWWDQFKATYAQRWWLRWRRWQVNYVQTPVTVERLVTVNVRDHWTYPQARIALPERDFGRPVYVATVNTTDRPWVDR